MLETFKLIERRARWAGQARPPGATLRRWYAPIACGRRLIHRGRFSTLSVSPTGRLTLLLEITWPRRRAGRPLRERADLR